MLKTTLTLAILTGALWSALPAAADFSAASVSGTLVATDAGLLSAGELARRGRSGCDTPRDIREHPECRA